MSAPARWSCVSTPEELAAERRAQLSPTLPDAMDSGYRRLYLGHVLQADEGCDFDFMTPRSIEGVAPVDLP